MGDGGSLILDQWIEGGAACDFLIDFTW